MTTIIQQRDIKMTEIDLSRMKKLLASLPKTRSVNLALESDLKRADVRRPVKFKTMW